MKLVDYKNRTLEIGQKVRIEQDIPSENGMLYKHSIVKVDEFNDTTKKIRVTDKLGKVCLGIDFKDGDSKNWLLDNIRLLCANCYYSFNAYFPSAKKFCK